MLTDFGAAFKQEEHQPFMWRAAGSTAALLIHGFPGSPSELRPLGSSLHKAGASVHGLLLPGFGPDIDTMLNRDQTDWIKATTSAYAALRNEYEKVIIVGYSLGGALAIETAAKVAQKPQGLVLIAPFWKVENIFWRLLPALQIIFPKPRIFRYLKLDFDKPEVREGIRRFMPNADLDDEQTRRSIKDFPMPIRLFSHIRTAGIKAYENAPLVDCPTLIVQGSDDDLVLPKITRKLSGRFGVKVDYREVPGGHEIISSSATGWPQLQSQVLTFFESLNIPENTAPITQDQN